MYVLKHVPADFIVEELLGERFRPHKQGAYLLIRVTKRDRNTDEVAEELARALHLPSRAVAYAGAKDRRAVTTQHMTIRQGSTGRVTQSRVAQLALAGVTIEPLGHLAEPLGLGLHEGNRFTITIRNLDPGVVPRLPPAVPNYFDEQRFSSQNIAVGKALVKKEFREACTLLARHERRHGLVVARHLDEARNDAVGALNRLPHRVLKRYLHAYQSLLWNELAARLLETMTSVRHVPYAHGTFAFPTAKVEQARVPIPGFGTDAPAKLAPLLDALLEREGITFRDFVIRQLPNLSLQGEERDLFMTITDFSLSEPEPDEAFPGAEKVVARFTLGKGSYATLLVRALVAARASRRWLQRRERGSGAAGCGACPARSLRGFLTHPTLQACDGSLHHMRRCYLSRSGARRAARRQAGVRAAQSLPGRKARASGCGVSVRRRELPQHAPQLFLVCCWCGVAHPRVP